MTHVLVAGSAECQHVFHYDCRRGSDGKPRRRVCKCGREEYTEGGFTPSQPSHAVQEQRQTSGLDHPHERAVGAAAERHVSQTVFVPLDESGEPITIRWDSDAGERCLVTRDEKDHFATWRIVDKDGAELRRGTWRTETTENE